MKLEEYIQAQYEATRRRVTEGTVSADPEPDTAD
jgi:hypothetical protein